MNDTIAILEPFIEPAPVKFSPEAPGWYIMGGIFLLILCIVAFFIARAYHKNRYLRTAIKWLEISEKKNLNTYRYDSLIYDANMLAKQISMRIYGLERVASLRGTEWINHLNETCLSARFSTTDETIINSIYGTDKVLTEQEATAFSSKIKHWIQKHRKRI